MTHSQTRKEELARNLNIVRNEIAAAASSCGRSPDEITLIVVTKTYPVSDIHILYELGERNFGENRDQEGAIKAPNLPDDAVWHFQGQIQSKKLKSICTWADVIHSLDDSKHAQKISELGSNAQIFIQVALEEILREERGGVAPENVDSFLSECIERLKLNVVGLMAVAPLNVDPADAFARLSLVSQHERARWPQVGALSAGMSGDFPAAIRAGATHVRVGSSILGERAPLK